jgi:protein FRA10AC1
MSWKTAGKLVSGPPIASGSGSGSGSNSNSNDRRFKQNTGGLSAFQREQQFAAHYGRHDAMPQETEGRTDWDVLKENHRFIRDDEEAGEVSWEERLARAYESKLFKEFALVSQRFDHISLPLPVTLGQSASIPGLFVDFGLARNGC